MITTSSTFSGTSLVSNVAKDGMQTDFKLEGHSIVPGSMATVTEAALWIVAVEGKGVVRDTSVICPASHYGLLLQDGSISGSNGPLLFENDTFDGNGVACLAPVAIMSGAGGTGSNILFVGGSSVDSKGGSGCPSGNGCLIDIDGSANTGNGVSNITFEDFYLETSTTSSSSMNFIEIKNARSVELNNIEFNGGAAITDCLSITESASGKVGYIHLTGRGGDLTNVAKCSAVSNSITGTSLTITGGSTQDIDYTYPGDQSAGGVVIDGPQLFAPRTFSTLPTCVSSFKGMSAAITDGPSSPTWAQAVTSGGGTQPVLLFCDGTNWTVAAK